ncbi:diguanylate cyclase [Alteromonas ponticola]|uniref:Diguanylate cyclase n=1 Tax=Alteromonas aquimaris TaxID=2998417 RepID=A0ABT3PB15_9ALTE|nr:diguanylate cyclase [Alteromonas aquimaris]MCW8109895.1 diguanylate cyclase [Alteromonas aquimaris]
MNDINQLNLKNILEQAHIGIVIHRWDTTIAYVNPKALELLRLSYDQIIGKSAYDPQWQFIDDRGRKLPFDQYPVNKVINSRNKLNNEIVGVIDGSAKDISWFQVNAYVEGEVGKGGFVIVTFTDISDAKKMFSFEDIVQNTQDIVIVTEAGDIDYPTGPRIVYVNKAFELLTGYSSSEVVGETPRILQGALTDKAATKRIHTALEKGAAVTETLLNYDKNGRPYWIEFNIIPLVNKYGETTHFAAIERDVSEIIFRQEQLKKRNEDLRVLKLKLEEIVENRTQELERAKAKLEKIAFFDPLTHAPNRRLFRDQIIKLISASQRSNSAVILGLLDIDDFKLVNDKFGHDIGDAVLVELAQAIQAIFRTEDTFCRYGGEEFAFAASASQEQDASVLGERLLNAARQLKVHTESKDVTITVSIGMTAVDAKEITDFEETLRDADKALYQAKSEGKDRFVVIT